MDDRLERRLIQAARNGAPESLGQALEACRFPLLFAANQGLPRKLQVKVAPSDLVQETFLEARRDFSRFHGETQAELLAWLRQLLRNNLLDASRKFCQTDKRGLSQEVPLGTGSSAGCLAGQVAAEQESPSAQAVLREEAELVERALKCLPDDYRQVVVLRSREERPFAEIGQKMGRSADAARKLWAAAIERLQDEMERRDG
jgi:RNA polymerase sigma-70 factor (ECF subfamily)